MIKVLVVDDSLLIRRLITKALDEDPRVEVVGTAADGEEAVARVEELSPDAVTLDVEMPVLDGLGALRRIRARHPRLPVVMFSTLTEKGALTTLQALSEGASDYVTKPSNTTSVAESLTMVREQLVPRLVALTGVRRLSGVPADAARRPARPTTTATPSTPTTPTTTPTADGPRRVPVAPSPAVAAPGAPEVLVVGCSTGGPDAFARVVAGLPADLPVPVLVVQHMPPVFTTMFARRLDASSGLEVLEAADGDEVRPGRVLVAPGDHHLRVRRGADGVVRAVVDQGVPENFCRPAVDVLFRSAAALWGGRAVAVVLTGMGADGREGVRPLRAAGARVLVQDQETSVVWGMPGAVAEAGLADEVLPLDDLAPRLATLLRRPVTSAR